MHFVELPASSHHPLTVVLTGGIASGKTAVSDLFQELGVLVIDTDLIAHQIVEPGHVALNHIIQTFGPDFLLPDGRLNREKMRNEVFENPDSRETLESILHPLIRAEALSQIKCNETPYCILVIPLYAESRNFMPADHVLLVDTEERTQLKRLMRRDSISRDMALSIIKAQASRLERLNLADEVIQNNGSKDELLSRVKQLHQLYLRLAEESGTEDVHAHN